MTYVMLSVDDSQHVLNEMLEGGKGCIYSNEKSAPSFEGLCALAACDRAPWQACDLSTPIAYRSSYFHIGAIQEGKPFTRKSLICCRAIYESACGELYADGILRHRGVN